MAYLPLSTANLPDPVIDPAQDASPEDYFGTLIWAGTGGNRTIADGESGVTGSVNFTPDFIWTKSRTSASSHMVYDTVRGFGDSSELSSNQTIAEGGDDCDLYGYVSGNTSGGFTTVAGSTNADLTNTSGRTYVAWNWKANGSGVSNTDGDFSVTVSASTESGFSIVDLTDPNTGASYEVGHGLNSPPEMFFIKKTNTTSDWSVYHKDVGNDRRLVLNGTDAQSGSSSVYFGSTTPTSTVVTIGSGLSTGDDWIMYCFHSVDGFSKLGSYVGNGSADGTFVYCGFRPAFIMVKRTDSTGSWFIWDTVRETINPLDQNLYANLSNAEASGNELGDALSNGFKIRGTGAQWNASGGTFIYMAFAENPFKYANAR